jgi:hypothetical protein
MEATWHATWQMHQQVFASMKLKRRVCTVRWRSLPNGVGPGAHVADHVAEHVAEHVDYIPRVRTAASGVLFIKVFLWIRRVGQRPDR